MKPAKRRRSFARGVPRAVVALVCLASYLVVAFGVPLPVAIHTGATGAFPCEHHGCGCHSAEQCWKQCCCFTQAERMAWYRRRGLEPPPGPIGKRTARLTSADSKCCHTGDKHKLAWKPRGQTKLPFSTSMVLVKHVQDCQGLGSYWLTIGAVLPVLAGGDFTVDLVPGEWLGVCQQRLESALRSPPVPPPRLALG
jgi:hypothetical protein